MLACLALLEQAKTMTRELIRLAGTQQLTY